MKLNLPKMSVVEAQASFWKRTLAFLIDILIIYSVILSPFRAAIKSLLPEPNSISEMISFLSSTDLPASLYLIAFSIFLLVYLYFVLMDFKIGQSVGKAVMKLSVKPKDLKLWQCLVRNLELIPFFPFAVLMFLDPIFLIFKGYRLSEHLAKTATVERVMV